MTGDEIIAVIEHEPWTPGTHQVWVTPDLVEKYSRRGYVLTGGNVDDVFQMERGLEHPLAREERRTADAREAHLEDLVANPEQHLEELGSKS